MTVETVETYANGTRPVPGTEVEVRRPTGALAIGDDQTGWNEQQLAALAQIGVADAPLGDQLVFLHHAQRTGLDPFAKQIYMIGRRDSDAPGGKKWTIQTGIDGFRVLARRCADRRRETLSYEEDMWCGPDGKWGDVWLGDGPPFAAKAVVVRNGVRFTAVARFASYAQKKYGGDLTRQWLVMPDVLTAKCAEALATRKAYPQDMSGIYIDAEMGQADNPDVGYRRVTSAEIAGEIAGEVVEATSAPPAGDVAGLAPAAEPQVSKAQQVAWWAHDHRRTAQQIRECLETRGDDPSMAETVADPDGVATTLAELLATRLGTLTPEPATEPATEGAAG